MVEGRSIRKSLQIVLSYCRITGIYPNPAHPTLFKLLGIFMFVFLTFNTIGIVICQYKRTDIGIFIANLTSLYSFLNYSYSVSHLCSYLRAPKIRDIVRDLTLVEKELNKCGFTFLSKTDIWSFMFLRVMLVFCSLIPKLIRQFEKPPPEPIMMTHLLFLFAFEPTIHLSTQFQQYAIFTGAGELSCFITAKLTDLGNLSPGNWSDTKGKLSALMRNHMKIARLCRELDSAYGFHFLISITSTFLQFTIDCANFVFLQRGQMANGVSGVVYFVMETSYLVATLVYDVLPSVKLRKKVTKFTEKLMELYLSDRVGFLYSNRTVELILNGSLLVTFTAKKFFVVDETIFLSMAGSLTSFIIILVQFAG